MNSNVSLIVLYLLTLIVIGYLLYLALRRPQTIQIYNEMPPPQKIDAHWWGYGWRPWWRRYAGIPGFGKDKPIPEQPAAPNMPVPPKPIIIPNA
jgi:hypothetical protein